ASAPSRARAGAMPWIYGSARWMSTDRRKAMRCMSAHFDAGVGECAGGIGVGLRGRGGGEDQVADAGRGVLGTADGGDGRGGDVPVDQAVVPGEDGHPVEGAGARRGEEPDRAGPVAGRGYVRLLAEDRLQVGPCLVDPGGTAYDVHEVVARQA